MCLCNLTDINHLLIDYNQIQKSFIFSVIFFVQHSLEKDDHRSFFLKTRNAHQSGTIIQSNMMPTVKRIPVPLPKKSLYKAPVYPINALTSIFNIIEIRPRSIGFSAESRRVIFSSG